MLLCWDLVSILTVEQCYAWLCLSAQDCCPGYFVVHFIRIKISIFWCSNTTIIPNKENTIRLKVEHLSQRGSHHLWWFEFQRDRVPCQWKQVWHLYLILYSNKCQCNTDIVGLSIETISQRSLDYHAQLSSTCGQAWACAVDNGAHLKDTHIYLPAWILFHWKKSRLCW